MGSNDKAKQTPLPDLLDEVPDSIVLGIPGDEPVFPSYTNIPVGKLARQAAAELRRLHAENEELKRRVETSAQALRQWLDKTEWIQETGRGSELGLHRADAIRQRLKKTEAQRDALLEALKGMLLHMGMDEDEWNRPTFDFARAAIKAVEGEKE